MSETAEPDLGELRGLLLDDAALVRAIASGRRRGERPPWRRVELRYVDLAAGRMLQVTSYDDTQAFTRNHADPEAAVDDLLAQPFGNWHLETTRETVQARVSKKGRVFVHRAERVATAEPDRSHDRQKPRLLEPGHPVLRELGIADDRGQVLPSRRAKYHQVEEFLRDLDATLDDAWAGGQLRRPTGAEPLHVVDLGCGNAYLTFAAQAHLADRGVPAAFTGVDVKQQSRRHNRELAERLGLAGRMQFVAGSIGAAELAEPPDVVLALHACDTATDDALARAVAWRAPVVLAAPCCHHDIAAQLRGSNPPPAYGQITRDGILRERFADTLTDALRGALLRRVGYRVEVVEFVPSRHTPRNTLIRAVHTGARGGSAGAEYDEMVAAWQLRPRLGELLDTAATP